MATISSTLSLVDNMTSKLNSIKSSADELITSMEGIGTAVNNSQTNIDNLDWTTFNKNCEEAGKKISNVGHKMTLAFTTPILLLGKKMYGASTGYETAFTGMTKTVEGTTEQYEHLYQMALNLSEVSPTGFIDLMGTMQTAGNLGVKVDEMDNFTRSYTALTAATDKHINGEAGAGEVANFLNIMDKGVGNIERFGSTIVYLGNNFNSTEDKILSMATRMASAADLAGFRTSDVLGMATAFSAVGINAEAGGSAASKMIKEMQLAAEVGRKGQELFGAEHGSAVDFSYYISDKDNLLGIAGELGVTTEYVESLSNSWLSLEQFSQVSGKTAEQFIADWKNNPAQGMIDFFAGLNSLDASGVESTLAALDKMGITEIRQSNLVAAMATNPQLFADAIDAAAKAYEENTAMWAEYEKQISTQEAQNQMLANKAENVSADLGDNVVEAVQPILDKVNELLTAFNNLSEVDQDKIVDVIMKLAITGPALTAIGKTVSAVGKISSGIQTIVTNAPIWGTKLLNFFSSPTGWVVLGAAAVGGLVALLESIPTTAESIQTNLKDIQITVDNDSVNETLAAIQKVKEASDALSGGQVTQEYENTSAAVQRGYGTNAMYGTALAYESTKSNAEINAIVNDYTAQIREAENQIANAATDAEAEAWLSTVKTLEAQMNADISAARQRYSENISALFNGMASQYPEAAKVLEDAASQYDLIVAMDTFYNVTANFTTDALNAGWTTMTAEEQQAYTEAYQQKVDAMKQYIIGLASQMGYIDLSLEEALTAMQYGTPFETIMGGVLDNVLKDLEASATTVSENPVLAGFLQSIISDPSVTENLDFTALQGALDGIVESLDFTQAIVNSEDANLFGQNLVQGLADGVTANVGLIDPPFTTIRDNSIAALQAAFNMHSPSVLMQNQGIFIPQGLALGIIGGSGIVNAAMLFMGMGGLNTLRSIATREQGFSIGYQVSAGMAAGIRSGQSSVISAARAVAQAAITAAKSTLGIHSPSTVFRGLAVNTGKGYVIGLNSMEDEVNKTVGRLFSVDTRALDGGVWSNIGLFSDLETQQFGADDNDDLKVSDSDMKKIRELAEREVINQFTTAELHIDFTANNNIHSDLDLDGVVSYLEDKVTERLEEVAEGVYQ